MDVRTLLEVMVKQESSDLYLTVDAPPRFIVSTVLLIEPTRRPLRTSSWSHWLWLSCAASNGASSKKKWR